MKQAKTILILMLILMLSACQTAVKKVNEPSLQQNTGASETSTISEHNSKKTAWLLTRQEGVEDPVQFLTNLDDPSGQSYIRIDDLVYAMQAKEDRLRFRDFHTNIGRITNDGSRMAVLREKMDTRQVIVQVYDLKAGSKELEFDMPMGTYPVISSDLSKYLYQINGVIYMYDTQNRQATRVELNHQDIDEGRFMNGKFSPDGTQFSMVNDQTGGIELIALSGKGVAKELLVGSNVLYIMQWSADDQMIYTRQDDQDNDSIHMCTLNIENESGRQIGEYWDSSVLSADGKKLVFLDDEAHTHLLDISTQTNKDISTMVRNEGTWAVPVQWIDTTTNYMKYSTTLK